MTPINRTLLAATLVAAPLLLASSEVVRKYVMFGKVDSDDPFLDTRDKIMQVAAQPDLWTVHSYLTLLGILAWLGAMIAIAPSSALGNRSSASSEASWASVQPSVTQPIWGSTRSRSA